MPLREAPVRELRLDRMLGARGATKSRVFERLDAGDTLPAIAKDLGIGASTLHGWIHRWRTQEMKEKELVA